MIHATFGVVQGGIIIPQTTLPEGTIVQITVRDTTTMPPDLQEEFDAWAIGNAGSLELVEELAEAGDAKG